MKINETNLIIEDKRVIATRLIDRRVYMIYININNETKLTSIKELDEIPNSLFIQLSQLRRAHENDS